MTKWKLVPVEPTPEMINAGADVECIITGIDEIDAPEDYQRVFTAMLEAAPQPPKLSDERILELMGFRAEGVVFGELKAKHAIDLARAIEQELMKGCV